MRYHTRRTAKFLYNVLQSGKYIISRTKRVERLPTLTWTGSSNCHRCIHSYTDVLVEAVTRRNLSLAYSYVMQWQYSSFGTSCFASWNTLEGMTYCCRSALPSAHREAMKPHVAPNGLQSRIFQTLSSLFRTPHWPWRSVFTGTFYCLYPCCRDTALRTGL
jgi:hypothetical protein